MATSTFAPSGQVLRLRRDDVFFSAMALLILGSVLLGFARTYYFAGVFAAHLPNPLVHVHAAVFSTWILLFIAQTSLVSAGRLDLHRRLGVLGAALAGAMVVLALLVATDSLTRGFVPPGFNFRSQDLLLDSSFRNSRVLRADRLGAAGTRGRSRAQTADPDRDHFINGPGDQSLVISPNGPAGTIDQRDSSCLYSSRRRFRPMVSTAYSPRHCAGWTVPDNCAPANGPDRFYACLASFRDAGRQCLDGFSIIRPGYQRFR
jgi:hypothetical protein